MKILFIVTLSELGGAQKYVRDLAVAYANEGHEIVVAAGGEAEGWFFKELSTYRHPELACPSEASWRRRDSGSRNKQQKEKDPIVISSGAIAESRNLTQKDSAPIMRSLDYARDDNSISFGFLDSKLSRLGMTDKGSVRTYCLPRLKRSTGFLREFRTLFDIIRIIKTERPDVLHLNSTKVGGLGGLAGRLTGTRSVYTVHGLVLNEPLPIFLWTFYWFLEKIAFAACDKIIVISKFDEQSVLKFHLAPKKKLSLVPLTIDPEQLNFLPRDEARQRLNHKITEITKTRPVISTEASKSERSGEISHDALRGYDEISRLAQLARDDVKFVGTIANFYPTKGLFTLIDAAKIVVSQKPEAKFVIIGDGPLRQSLESRIMNHELSDHVFLVGKMENASQYLPAFDLFVLSSIKEGLPQVLWEAAAAGIPVVTTNVGGIPDIYEYNFGRMSKSFSVIPDPDRGSKQEKNFKSFSFLDSRRSLPRTEFTPYFDTGIRGGNDKEKNGNDSEKTNWLLIPPRDPQLLAEKILFALDHLKPEPQKTKETLQEEFQKFASSTKSIYQLLASSE